MTGFDYIVFIAVGFAAIAGFFRGFVEEALSLSAWCLAMLAVHYGHAALTAVLTDPVGSETGAGVIAFVLLLVVPYFATKFAASLMGKVSRSSPLGPVDRVLGFGFGAIKGFVIAVLVFSLVVFSYDVVWGAKGRPAWIRGGRTYLFLNAASDELMSLITTRREEALEAARAPATDAATDAASGDRSPPPHRAHRRRAARADDQ